MFTINSIIRFIDEPIQSQKFVVQCKYIIELIIHLQWMNEEQLNELFGNLQFLLKKFLDNKSVIVQTLEQFGIQQEMLQSDEDIDRDIDFYNNAIEDICALIHIMVLSPYFNHLIIQQQFQTNFIPNLPNLICNEATRVAGIPLIKTSIILNYQNQQFVTQSILSYFQIIKTFSPIYLPIIFEQFIQIYNMKTPFNDENINNILMMYQNIINVLDGDNDINDSETYTICMSSFSLFILNYLNNVPNFVNVRELAINLFLNSSQFKYSAPSIVYAFLLIVYLVETNDNCLKSEGNVIIILYWICDWFINFNKEYESYDLPKENISVGLFRAFSIIYSNTEIINKFGEKAPQLLMFLLEQYNQWKEKGSEYEVINIK